MVRPERRRRGDIAAAAFLVVGLVVAGTLYGRSSDAAGTTSVLARPALTAPAAATALPAAFTEAWRARSPATPEPVVAGPAVVTGEGGVVSGRDAVTGEVRWSYGRELPLCGVDDAFPAHADGVGLVMALHSTGAYCSELTALRPDTGARDAQRNPDVGAGARMVAGRTLLTLIGSEYLEVVRSDMVKTLEFGAVPAPEQPNRQPRTGCTFGSAALAPGRLGVVERCPGEPTPRLTVLDPDGTEGADTPQEEFSVPLPAGTLVALSAERAAVAVPGPPRLLLFDGAGLQVAAIPLDGVPDADVAAGGPATVAADDERVYWWTGSRTVALDREGLAPVWSSPGALGPGTGYAGAWLVPVPGGLRAVDPATGAPIATLPVDRGSAPAPVRLAALGGTVLELRGPELVALRPA